MTREEFDARVARLDAFAQAHPRLYKVRIVAMAMLGYGYLATMVALLVALLGLAVASVVYLKFLGVKLLLVIAPFVWLVARSLWVEVNAPVGIAVSRRNSPALFERIDRIRRALGAPRFHEVVVNDEFNAAVVQVPLLGLFGWHRNYLVLGMPLLKALTPDQLDAVLAHEFGHLAGGHARFANWLYRLRMAWAQLLDELARANSFGDLLFRPFLQWYSPRFSAYTFPLARANEYEADAVSARLTSPRAAAEALTAVNVVGAFLSERYWPRILATADHQPAPAFAPFAALGSVRDALPPEDTQRWLERSLQQRTTSEDTHPALADRLRAIGAEPALAVPGEGEGADQLLGAARDSVVSALDDRWQNHVIHDWGQRYAHACASRERLAELDELESRDALAVGDAVERACLTDEFGAGRDAAMAQLRAIIERDSDCGIAYFALGVRLLAADDESGVALMERAIELEPEAIAPGREALRDFHWRRGDRAAADRDHEKVEARRREEYKAHVERASINLTDTYLRHGLPHDTVAALAASLKGFGVRKAWLLQKRCNYDSDRPLYVLAVRASPFFSFYREERGRLLENRIVSDIALPGETIVVCVEGQNYRFERKFRWRRGARIL